MEEEKAAALYEQVTKKGQSAARFKHGLGFSVTNSSSSSSNENVTFVKASSDNTNTNNKQTQLQSIHNKLNLTKKYRDSDIHRDHRDRDHSRDRRHKRRSSSRDRERRRRRSMSRSDSDGERKQRRRSVSRSPERKRGDATREKRKSVGINYAKLIRGYEKMSPAERIKAKMKYQLSETAEKDAMNGMGSGWERFEFDKDAPLDDEEMEVADDDVALVKHIGQSFRFSAVEANRDNKIKAAHDEAMFGSSRVLSPIHTEDIMEQKHESKSKESASATSLLSDKVIAGQQGSWRDRARKG